MLSTGGGIKRMFGGMPFTITTATGPGHIAFSRDSAGELVVLPIGPEHEIDVREHAFVGSHSPLNYSFRPASSRTANPCHGQTSSCDKGTRMALMYAHSIRRVKSSW